MDQVLIVDSDKGNLEQLKDGLNKLNQFTVLLAHDGEEALEVLGREKISVFVTDFNTEKIEGLELLAFMTRNHPSMPCILMTDYGKPWYRDRLDQEDVLYHLEKPVDIGTLASAIFVGLNLKDEGLSYKGMSMSSFLPLIEVEQKTCRMEVESVGKGKGYLYFNEGVLIDAHYENLRREKAAQEMANWDNIKVIFSDLPRRRTSKRVKSDLMDIAGATWDKNQAQEAPEIEAIDLRPPAAEYPPTERTVIPGGSSTDRSAAAATAPATDSPAEEGTSQTDHDTPYASCVERHKDELRAVNGYKGVGVFDANGNLLSCDCADPALDMEHLGKAFNQIFAAANGITLENRLNECYELTVHTPEGVFMWLSTGNNEQYQFQVLGHIASVGNWYFMRFKLEKMIPEILEELRT
jgi:CheY-like chemotaxis protein